MIASCLSLAGAARLLGLPRWRLWMLIRTGRFIPPDHTDAAGRDHGTAPASCAGAPRPPEEPQPTFATNTRNAPPVVGARSKG